MVGLQHAIQLCCMTGILISVFLFSCPIPKFLLFVTILYCCRHPHSWDMENYEMSAVPAHLAAICLLRDGTSVSVCTFYEAAGVFNVSKYNQSEV